MMEWWHFGTRHVLVLFLVSPHAQALQRAGEVCPREWVDQDSPASACTAVSHHDGKALQLVFSDEFEVDDRTFEDGHDSRWTSIERAPFTNHQVNFYNKSLARTHDGKLKMACILQDKLLGEAADGTQVTKHFQTAMLQSWNKFCMQEGAIEISARLPGFAHQPGLWPAFWLMGNLGRATYTASTAGLWPWTFDACVEDEDCDANQCSNQRISACSASNAFGMNPHQGRGAPEIDVVEAMPGSAARLYNGDVNSGCPVPSADQRGAAASSTPLVSTSLMLAPGMPTRADQRPPKGCLPVAGEWYDGYTHLGGAWAGAAQQHDLNVSINYEFWGDIYEDYLDGRGLQTDALSANTELSATHWDAFHVYRVEWRTGRDGFMRWTLDGQLQFEIDGRTLAEEHELTINGKRLGTLRPRTFPKEPMYAILNVDMAPQWGWPTHHKDFDCTGCECCFDCARTECIRCIRNDPSTGEPYNAFEWFAELCEMLQSPVEYEVEWVRAYQLDGRKPQVSCDPASHPTHQWIAAHQDEFKLPTDEVPLLAVVPGGGTCEGDEDCGSSARGECSSSRCTCRDGWVGPRCLSQAAGAALTCHELHLWSDNQLFAVAAVEAAEPSTWLSDELTGCAVPANYNITMLQYLASALCNSSHPFDSSQLLDAACKSIDYAYNGAYAGCSAASRAAHVLDAHWQDGGRAACCNRLARLDDGKLVLRCMRPETGLWMILPLGLVCLGAAILTVLRAKWHGRRSRLVGAHARAEGASVEMPLVPPEPIAFDDAELLQTHQELMSEERRAVRLEHVQRLGGYLGCQPDSCALQAAHLESLLLSKASRHRCTYNAAITALYDALLEPYLRWRQHICSSSSTVHKSALSEEDAQFKLWESPSPHEQLEDVIVYLLIWGEAGNLRFMPELICLLFECARAFVRHHQTRDVNADATATRLSLLEHIVRPIYSHIFSESFSGLNKGRPTPHVNADAMKTPLNYDDWNEACWSRVSLERLRTYDGTAVLAVHPSERWQLLVSADWKAFFDGAGKSFLEVRWWWCLLAGNRRIHLLHAFTFVATLALAMPNTEYWSFDGWRSAVLLPVLFLLPLCSVVSGLIFESRYASLSWAGGRANGRLRNALFFLMIGLTTTMGSALYIYLVSFDTFRAGAFVNAREIIFAVAALLLFTFGTGAFLSEMLPQRPSPDAFDANLFFEARTARLAHQPWLRWSSLGFCRARMRREVTDLLRMYAFWLLVWGLKTAFAAWFLIPAACAAHTGILDGVFLETDYVAYHTGLLLRHLLLVGIWTGAVICFYADTLLWYNIVLSVWGGTVGLFRHTSRRSDRIKQMRQNVLDKLMPWARAEGRSSAHWHSLWQAVLDDLYTSDLITFAEKEQLLSDEGALRSRSFPANYEARRRLNFFARSLGDPSLPASEGILSCAGLTVLVPHYAETILLSSKEIGGDAPVAGSTEATRRGQHIDRVFHSPMPLLVELFKSDYINFVARAVHKSKVELSQKRSPNPESRAPQGTTLAKLAELAGELEVRKWASLRLQTLYRTLAGMMKNRHALKLLLRAQVPSLPDAQLEELVDSKFTLLAALQRYAVMSREELADTEVLLREFPSLTIAYIEERKSGDSSSHFYSCQVDGKCAYDEQSGRRLPRYCVELPGHPILGNGKSDNQNHALIFSRGEIIQAIDANQDGYLEESLKVPCCLREFDSKPAGSQRGPSIVGFREHIFSGVGSLGKFAASSEFVFGSLAQRTMAGDLGSRYHYGHPDMLDKLAMMAQGGISKATRGLNLSEDVFAGMDAQLRGGSVVHREYYQVGKGRDMGFLSILGFFCKLSSGTAQMSTSRQAYRLGVRLGTARLFGFYYAHAGYYVGQLFFYHATYVVTVVAFFGALCDGCGMLPRMGTWSVVMLGQVYGPLYLLFFASSLLPLFFATLAEHGPARAVHECLVALLSGSPIFFAFQSRCIGHHISGEFDFGGATYIATGRGVALTRQPFTKLYSAFASSCILPGAESAAMLLLAPLVSSVAASVHVLTWVVAAIMPISLLFAPAIFNPRCFELRLLLKDMLSWMFWLCNADPSGDGWVAHHKALVSKRRNVATHAFVLPSKEMVFSLALMLLARESMRGHGWSIWTVPLIALPLGPLLISAVLLITVGQLSQALRLQTRTTRTIIHMLGGVCCTGTLVAEVVIVHALHPSLPLPHWVVLAATRYFSWRWIANATSYVPEYSGDGCNRIIAPLLKHTVANVAFVGESVLGLLIQLPVLLVSLLICIPPLHIMCLLHTSSRRLQNAASLHEDRQRHLHKTRVAAQAWVKLRRGLSTARMQKLVVNSVAKKHERKQKKRSKASMKALFDSHNQKVANRQEDVLQVGEDAVGAREQLQQEEELAYQA